MAVALDYLAHYFTFIGPPADPLVYFGLKYIAWAVIAYFGFEYLEPFWKRIVVIALGGAFASAAILQALQPYNYALVVHMAHALVIGAGVLVAEKAVR